MLSLSISITLISESSAVNICVPYVTPTIVGDVYHDLICIGSIDSNLGFVINGQVGSYLASRTSVVF